jgi:uncharacterized surface protein with fasciclin (FAS1) repeats
MKKTFIKFFVPVALSLSVLVLATGCKNDDDDPPVAGTITDVVVSNANFSTLESAVVKANLQATLRGTGPFTVFAPDDAAFNASGITSTVLNSLTPAQVSTLLLYHTLPGKILAAGAPAGPNAKVITANGDSVFVTKNAAGVFVNGVKVTQADIAASNGVIHRIGRVLNVPTGNTVGTAQASTGVLDSLVKAIVRVNNAPGGDPNLISMLSTATITVFAPTNTAFVQALSTLGYDEINDIPVSTLSAVLNYHVVRGRAFSSDLANGSLPMLAGVNTTINLTNGTGGGPTITGNGNGSNRSNITSTNIVTRNGVVHLIDRVLRP